MFSPEQKREIADKIQIILRETNHPELPVGEIQFVLHVSGEKTWAWSDIHNNGAVLLDGKPAQTIIVPGPNQNDLGYGCRL